jgi:pyrroline-5-carboxylate reductase
MADVGGRPACWRRAAAADLVCLAVKPKDAGEASRPWRPDAAGAVLLSVIAGWDLDRLAAAAPGPGLARTMPNLPSATAPASSPSPPAASTGP